MAVHGHQLEPVADHLGRPAAQEVDEVAADTCPPARRPPAVDPQPHPAAGAGDTAARSPVEGTSRWAAAQVRPSTTASVSTVAMAAPTVPTVGSSTRLAATLKARATTMITASWR